jgi:uncharacterized membrane protein YfcA
MTTPLLIVGTVFFAACVQSISGFGFALIVMPLLSMVVGLQTAAPLVALAALTLYAVNLIRYRQAVDVRRVLRLGVACAFGVPVGIWALANVDEFAVKRLMGLVLVAYAVYKLSNPAALYLRSDRWAYLIGFIAGCMGGAYNAPGPPLVVYGSLRQWPRDEFRATLQAFFFINGVLTVSSHYVAHHLTATVWTFYAYAVPAFLLGVLAGSRIDERLNRDRFCTIVTVMILVLGLSLIFG